MGGEGVKSRGERWRAWWVWGVAAAARGVRRRVAAAKASARQGQRGHQPGRLLSLAVTMMLLARRSAEESPGRREAVQRPNAGLLLRAPPAASTDRQRARGDGGTAPPPARQAAVLVRHDDAAGPEIDGGVARGARGRSTAQRRAAGAGIAGGQHRQTKGTRRWGSGAAMSPAGCCPEPPG